MSIIMMLACIDMAYRRMIERIQESKLGTYFGDIYTCVMCEQAKGISIFDDNELSQDDYIKLADNYITQNNAQVLHISHNDRICRSCIKPKVPSQK